jgi:phosphoserine phosphatase
MHRLAAPEAMPELLREIIEVGKVAIVAEAGVLWLLDRDSNELVMVAPTRDEPPRVKLGDGLAGECMSTRKIINIDDCRSSRRFQAAPIGVPEFETRSILCVPILGKDEQRLGVMQWLGKHPRQFDRHDEWIGPALAAEAAIAIQHSYMTDELLANAILRREVAVAREIQISTLPESMPDVDGYDVHGHFLPTDHTGGDLYDLVVLDDRLFMLLGDATGHGFGPALSATQMQAMLRVAFRLGADINEAYVQVNNQLAEDLPDDRFITAFVGFLDPKTHVVDFHSGGQGPILHFRAADGHCDWYKPTSFPLGAMEIDHAVNAKRLTLDHGDILALITDGIYEYTALDGTQFGEARVAEIISSNHRLPMNELCRKLVDAAIDFGGDAPQADDITLALIRRLPANSTGEAAS